MTRRRRWDYDLIKALIQEDPSLAQDTVSLVQAYNRRGKEKITPKVLRRIVYTRYEKWFGEPVQLLTPGRRPIHDADYVRKLRKDNPDVPIVKLVEIYNKNKQLKISASRMAQILRTP